jgi:hypothetical protein
MRNQAATAPAAASAASASSASCRPATYSCGEPPPNAASAGISALVQPSSLPRSGASTSRNSPPVSVIWPGQSIPRAAGSRDSCTYARVAAMQSSPIGRLMRKIQRRSRPLVRAPPTSGPTAKDAPIVAPYAARAPARIEFSTAI